VLWNKTKSLNNNSSYWVHVHVTVGFGNCILINISIAFIKFYFIRHIFPFFFTCKYKFNLYLFPRNSKLRNLYSVFYHICSFFKQHGDNILVCNYLLCMAALQKLIVIYSYCLYLWIVRCCFSLCQYFTSTREMIQLYTLTFILKFCVIQKFEKAVSTHLLKT
jgi:hypothetical protein